MPLFFVPNKILFHSFFFFFVPALSLKIYYYYIWNCGSRFIYLFFMLRTVGTYIVCTVVHCSIAYFVHYIHAYITQSISQVNHNHNHNQSIISHIEKNKKKKIRRKRRRNHSMSIHPPFFLFSYIDKNDNNNSNR